MKHSSQKLRFEDFAEQVAAAGFSAFGHKSGRHWKLVGGFCGQRAVNVYPKSNRIFVDGAVAPLQVTRKELVSRAIAIAKGEAEVCIERDKRITKSTAPLRERIWNAGPAGRKHVCFICQEAIETFDEASLEHIIPLSKGGSNRRHNLTLTHERCNIARGNRTERPPTIGACNDNLEV